VRLLPGRSSALSRVLPPLLGGCLVALAAGSLWTLPARYFLAAVGCAGLLCLSMLFLRHLDDWLLVAIMLSTWTASLVKYVAGHEYVESQGIAVIDVLLVGAYALWFLRVFVTRRAPPPRLAKADAFVLLLVAAHVLSVPSAPNAKLGLYAIIYLMRFVLMYFYVSRHLQRRHVPWLFGAVFLAIFVQGALGGYQTASGRLVGLAMDRGTGRAMDLQYEVPGIEDRSRATGTTLDSHAYGTYMAMLAPFAFVALFMRPASRRLRVLAGPALVLSMIGVLISFSRSAWVCCALALAIVWWVYVVRWRERHLVPSTMLLGVVLLMLAPWALEIIIDRMDVTLVRHMTARFDQFPVAWDMLKDNPFLGVGAGNYMEALDTYNRPGVLALPAHNVFLWVAAETGLLGAAAFVGMVAATFARLWKVARAHRDPACRVALACLAGLVAYVMDGLTDPLFREPVIYTMFWLIVAMSVALSGMDRQSEPEADQPALAGGDGGGGQGR
jgi:O-antigen ligase